MKNKKMIVVALALLVLVAVLLGVYALTRPETALGAKTFTVTVVHADGSEKEFTYRTEEEYLGPVLLTEGLVEGEMGPYGLAIYTVDGEAAIWEENGAYWALYIGQDYATTGTDTTPVYDGSQFSLVYTLG